MPMENVHPQEGPFLDYGVVIGWEDRFGRRCSRKQAFYAVAEPSGGKFGDWDEWCEEHAWRLVTLSEFEAAQEEGGVG